MYISITLSAYINVSTAFSEKHNRLRDSRLSLVRPSGGLRLVADKTTKKKKIKPRVDYEPRSAHGRAVNKENNICNTVRVSMFQKLLANKHCRLPDSRLSLIRPSGGLGLSTRKQKKTRRS